MSDDSSNKHEIIKAWISVLERQEYRAKTMPSEQDALQHCFDAYQRLKDLGWRDIIYCPKDGTVFDAIEAGSTGVHRCKYMGEWPKGGWWILSPFDLSPSRPILFRLITAPVSSERRKDDLSNKNMAGMVKPGCSCYFDGLNDLLARLEGK